MNRLGTPDELMALLDDGRSWLVQGGDGVFAVFVGDPENPDGYGEGPTLLDACRQADAHSRKHEGT